MATLYKTAGTTETVTPANGTDFSLEELQGFVGGCIEVVLLTFPSGKERLMIVNEDGIGENLPVNVKASLFHSEFSDALMDESGVRGDV